MRVAKRAQLSDWKIQKLLKAMDPTNQDGCLGKYDLVRYFASNNFFFMFCSCFMLVSPDKSDLFKCNFYADKNPFLR